MLYYVSIHHPRISHYHTVVLSKGVMPNLKMRNGPGFLKLWWKKTEITPGDGAILRLCTDAGMLLSNKASWEQLNKHQSIGRWLAIPASIIWKLTEDTAGCILDVVFHLEKAVRCQRLELVLPLVPHYGAWRITGLTNPSELIDPGIFGEEYNLDFLDLRSSGFFAPAATNDSRYHLLAASPRPILQAGSFSHKWPLIQIEALADVALSAAATVPDGGGTGELRLLAWPNREGRKEMPAGEYKISARITVGKSPRRWSEEALREHLDAVGAATGKVLQGPIEVQISPTNRCNQICIACWCHAPFQREKSSYPAWASQQIDLGFFEKLVDEVAQGGTPVVSLIGQGDPLLHKDILAMIKMVKDRGMRCRLNTNGLLLNPALNKKLVESGLDRLHVSLWTARPETYARLHPGGKGSELERIEAAIQDLSRAKEEAHSPLPYLELFHAICKENIDEIEQLIAQAERLGADSIYLRPLCVIRGKTEDLLPTKEELERLRHRLADARARLRGASSIRTNFNEYLDQVTSQGAGEGRYRGHRPDEPCYLGWAYAMVHANGAMTPCCLGGPLTGPMESPHEFLPMWMSEPFQEFRTRGLDMNKNLAYFAKRFPCLTECCMDAVNDVVRKKVEIISSASGEFPSFRKAVKRTARRAEKNLRSLLRRRGTMRRRPMESNRVRPCAAGGHSASGYAPCENP